ncbi:hypothetical protein V501_00523 [Pseudogymnoascus sp. VKM F-4519 (FW-2642)]|nr:hypothetical protein V501_00523 [Pseudogymnoascus sp. VKM F-4519 (FW-2642)]
MNLSTSHLTGPVNGELGKLYTIPAQINGKEVILSPAFDVHSPINGSLIHRCSSASVADALSAVTAAQAAFPEWRDLPPAAKRDIFLNTAEIFKSRNEELLKYMIDETGASEFWSDFNITLAADILKDIAGRISSLKGDAPITGNPGTSAIVYKEPYGVILGIAPWNAPYILGVRSIAYALAAGNTAILKASEFSPRCAWAIADCFRLGGLPAGVLNTIAHFTSSAAAITEALIADSRVQKINFTGSTVVGRIIAETAGRHLKPVLLELGGKAPVIVCEDADLEVAATECAKGAFMHCGQVCMSTEKILVHKDVAAAFEERYREKVVDMFTKQGVLINRAAVDRNMRLVRDAVGKGAEVLTGTVEQDHQLPGTHMSPIVVKGVTEAMELYNTESFGPTVSIIEVETEEEAVRIANDTPYGLTSSVFTEDLRRGLRLAKRIESGAVHINGMTLHDETMLPHGGVKCSGYGRFGSGGLEEWVRSKTVTFKN